MTIRTIVVRVPRLVFSGPDLGRIRFAIMPFQETLKAARGLGLRQPPAGLAGWRHAAHPLLPAAARPALALCGAHPRHLPDFLTPQPPSRPQSFDDELSAALDDPTAPVAEDTAAFAGVLRTTVPVVDDLIQHPDEGRRALARSFVALHRAVLAVDWPRLQAQLAADVAYRARLAARHGVATMLDTLCPRLVRWEYPYLEFAGPPTADYALDGRGLVLAPSMFLTDEVHRQFNDRQQPMLFYPARTAAEFWRDGARFDGPDGRLAGPVGPHRAVVLRVLADRSGLGTGELAAALGVAPSTASAHVARLRRAGLVITARSARRARHELTPLGWQLLDANVA
jgi:DNA-binding transcriptional ArsR family regulator